MGAPRRAPPPHVIHFWKVPSSWCLALIDMQRCDLPFSRCLLSNGKNRCLKGNIWFTWAPFLTPHLITPKDIATRRRDDHSGTHFYHRANFPVNRLHRCRDICCRSKSTDTEDDKTHTGVCVCRIITSLAMIVMPTMFGRRSLTRSSISCLQTDKLTEWQNERLHNSANFGEVIMLKIPWLFCGHQDTVCTRLSMVPFHSVIIIIINIIITIKDIPTS